MDKQRQSDGPAIAVLKAVAERENVDITELPFLRDTIDVEALDKLFSPTYDGTLRDSGSVRFPYAGYTVTVHGDGDVELYEQ